VSAWSFLPARAKLNLVLRVIGRRADGYHLLQTLFHALELHDDLALRRRTDRHTIVLDVRADDPGLVVAPGPDNLVVRALELLRAATGERGGFDAVLHKRIPHGGGLGGGSSDAAAALRLGNEALGRPLSEPALARLAARLGADVPFFLRSGSQWGQGVGDELTPATVPQRHFVLLLPPFGCATAEVYKIHRTLWQPPTAADTVPTLTVPDNWDAAVSIGCCNDLLGAAERLRPELAQLRRAVVERGYPQVAMTGSGSTLFVTCVDAVSARQCARDLEDLVAAGTRTLVTASGPPVADAPSSALPATVVPEDAP
jgi:4-diphosphocytidyl-2-C-methyl-D-erythritol kinase